MKIPSYQTYLSNYKKKANQLAKRGYSMNDQAFSLEEYYDAYTSLRNKQKEEVLVGKRKRAGNVMRDLINDQAYERTRKQAEALAKAAKEFGIKTNVMKIMSGDPQVTQILREQRQLLKDSGYTSTEIALIIGQEYFGSP